MGYKLFGTCSAAINKVEGKGSGEIRYTAAGHNMAYVQYQQPVPQGFERLRQWPVALFDRLAPPASVRFQTPSAKRLVKLPEKLGHDMESTPILYRDQILWFHSHRVDRPQPDLDQMYLLIRDPATGRELSQFGRRHSLGSALVDGETVHVFAAEHGRNPSDWFGDIDHFSSTDLKTWRRHLAIARDGGEHLLNSSVCRDEQGYLMAYESDVPVKFCFKFARSKDLNHWEKVAGVAFAGPGGKQYSACPVIRYCKPYYYVIYVVERRPGRGGWVPVLARSADLVRWQLSPRNPVMEPCAGEGINNSDVDLIEIGGRTYVNYFTGNQDDWGDLKWAVYDGPMPEFFASYFPPGQQTVEFSIRTQ